MNNTENPLTVSELQNLANLARLDLIEISEGMRESIHWGSAFSIMEIAGVLYSNVIDEKKDMVLLSKGQGGPGIYALMHRLGLISDETWKTFHCDGSSLSELMEYNKKLGFYISGGSLGLALSYACGVGLLWKKTKKDGRIYVIMGDGEVDEGSVWEAFMSIGHFKLDNITLIIDANGLQSDGEVDMIMPLPDLGKTLREFCWDVCEVDGHDCQSINQVLLQKSTGIPKLVICHTIKGKGVSFMEGDPTWHDRTMTKAEFQKARNEVNNCVVR